MDIIPIHTYKYHTSPVVGPYLTGFKSICLINGPRMWGNNTKHSIDQYAVVYLVCKVLGSIKYMILFEKGFLTKTLTIPEHRIFLSLINKMHCGLASVQTTPYIA